MTPEKEIESLKVVYKEIVDGYSFFEDKGLYIRHFSELDNAEMVRKKHQLFLRAQKDGLSTEKERLEQLNASEEWTLKDEDDLVSCRYIISDNEKNLSKIIPQQQGNLKKIIEEERKKLEALSFRRSNALGLTAEKLAEDESLGYYLFHAFFKNAGLTQRLFTDEMATNELEEDDDIKPYITMLRATFGKFTDENVKKVSALPFFLNYFAESKDCPYHFYGRPICSWSSYQLNLASFGGRNLMILRHSKGSPPELLGDVKLIDVINWYDLQYSIISTEKPAK